MSDLFAESRKANAAKVQPLAARMRPRTLEEFAGQGHFLAAGKLLRRMIDADRLVSLIFYGPPGTGKTTLAHLIASRVNAHFAQLNAAACGIKEVREVLEAARARVESGGGGGSGGSGRNQRGGNQGGGGGRTLLFIDEIHRFSRSQQDVLLPDVEAGVVLLIGATTENPFFSVNAPLVSRSQIFQFQPLNEQDIVGVLNRAMSDTERGLGRFKIRVDDDAMAFWATTCDGDARRALTALEIAVLSLAAVRDGGADASGGVVDATRMQMSALNEGGADLSKELHITLEVAQESMQRKAIVYDATGDEHYDATSALIKSIRGSDVNAAVYWLARMLEAGEDPRFISRRLAILASEDIGQADPTSLLVAAAAQTVTERIGMPECQLTLAQAAIHLALAPKSNSTTIAIGEALKDVREGRTVPVPVYLKDAHYAGAEKLGHGVGYVSPHKALAKGETPPIADYLGVDRTYYRPIASGREARFVKDAGEEKE